MLSWSVSSSFVVPAALFCNIVGFTIEWHTF